MWLMSSEKGLICEAYGSCSAHEVVIPDLLIPSNRQREDTVALANGKYAGNAESLVAIEVITDSDTS